MPLRLGSLARFTLVTNACRVGCEGHAVCWVAWGWGFGGLGREPRGRGSHHVLLCPISCERCPPSRGSDAYECVVVLGLLTTGRAVAGFCRGWRFAGWGVCLRSRMGVVSDHVVVYVFLGVLFLFLRNSQRHARHTVTRHVRHKVSKASSPRSSEIVSMPNKSTQ